MASWNFLVLPLVIMCIWILAFNLDLHIFSSSTVNWSQFRWRSNSNSTQPTSFNNEVSRWSWKSARRIHLHLSQSSFKHQFQFSVPILFNLVSAWRPWRRTLGVRPMTLLVLLIHNLELVFKLGHQNWTTDTGLLVQSWPDKMLHVIYFIQLLLYTFFVSKSKIFLTYFWTISWRDFCHINTVVDIKKCHLLSNNLCNVLYN